LAVSGGDGGGGKTQLLAAVETPAMTVFTGSSPVFPISLCFLFFFPSVLLLSLSFFLFFFLSRFSPLYPYFASLFFLSISLPFFFLFSFFRSLFLLSLPLYRKNRGERGKGGHCAAAPKAT
jgi:hypothetical protein